MKLQGQGFARGQFEERKCDTMKKRLISGLLATAMVLGMVLSSFPTAFAAEESTKVWASWKVADNIKAGILAAKNAAEAELTEGETVTYAQIGAKIKASYKEWAYTPMYYSEDKIGVVQYGDSSWSRIVTGNITNEAYWRCQLQIPNNQGFGDGYSASGVIIATECKNETQKVTFTAPVHGKYNFVPLSIGGGDEIEESLWSITGAFNISIYVKGVLKGSVSVDADDATEDVVSKTNLPALNDIELKEGETIELQFTAPKNYAVEYQGNQVQANFKVDLVDEIAPQVLLTHMEEETFVVADELQVTNTSGWSTKKTGLLTVGTYGATGFSGSDLVAGASARLKTGYSFYTIDTSWNTKNVGLVAEAETDIISIGSKYKTAQHGIIITAQKKGIYTLSASAVTDNVTGYIGTVKVETPEGIAYSTSVADADGFNITAELDVGEKMYLYMDLAKENNQFQVATFEGLTLNCKYIPVIYHEAVYNTTEFDVRTELLKNNISSTNPNVREKGSTLTFTGKFDIAASKTSLTPFVESDWWAMHSPGVYDRISDNEPTQYMYIYEDDSFEENGVGFRWKLHGYPVKYGFKYTVDEAATHVWNTGTFSIQDDKKAENGYYIVVKVNSEGKTILYNEPITIDESYEAEYDVAVGDTIYLFVGFDANLSTDWNGDDAYKNNFYQTDVMTITEKVLKKDAYYEEVELEYIDDPDYEYKYEVENIKISASSAIAEPGQEVEVKLTVDQCHFGYSAFSIKVPYDAEKLSVISVEAGEAITEFIVDPIVENNPLVLVFTQAENLETGEGVIATIKFNIKDEAEGSVTILPVVETMIHSVINGNNAGIEYVTDKVTVTPGTITIDPGCEHNIEGVEWTPESDGDCQTKGTEVKLCSLCGKVVERQDTVLGDHDIEGVEWTHGTDGDCCTKGTEVKLCTICGEVADTRDTVYGDHDWNDWSTTILPDWDSTGEEERTCKLDANHKETNPLPVGVVESVTVKTPPTKLTYQKDGTFDPTGLVVEVTYSNYDHVTTVTDFSGVPFNYDFSATGQKEVKFTIAGEELVVNVEVVDGIIGDVNGDTFVDTLDAIAILRYVAGYTDPTTDITFGNYNGEGEVDTLDAIAILRFVAGYND